MWISAYLWDFRFNSPYNSQIKTSTKAVFEEDGGAAAVEASLRDDGHPVTQQVCLIHVVGGHYDCAPCNTGMDQEVTITNIEPGKNNKLYFLILYCGSE